MRRIKTRDLVRTEFYFLKVDEVESCKLPFIPPDVKNGFLIYDLIFAHFGNPSKYPYI
jgi:hypothetical protein